MYTIKETFEKKLSGLYYGNRLILPFRANFLKIIVDNDIFTDFSPLNRRIHISETDSYTDIYIQGVSDYHDEISRFESIKILAVEKDADIFDLKNHIKITLYLEEDHKLKIEQPGDDILFIE